MKTGVAGAGARLRILAPVLSLAGAAICVALVEAHLAVDTGGAVEGFGCGGASGAGCETVAAASPIEPRSRNC